MVHCDESQSFRPTLVKYETIALDYGLWQCNISHMRERKIRLGLLDRLTPPCQFCFYRNGLEIKQASLPTQHEALAANLGHDAIALQASQSGNYAMRPGKETCCGLVWCAPRVLQQIRCDPTLECRQDDSLLANVPFGHGDVD